MAKISTFFARSLVNFENRLHNPFSRNVCTHELLNYGAGAEKWIFEL